jgi:octaprenyl-diphosphate synthase
MPRLLEIAPEHPSITSLVESQLDEVELVIERQLASDLPAVNALCSHVERYRGKMLRPTMVLLSGLAASGEPCDGRALRDAHRVIAAVAELIHMATLVHDDVLDEALVRRQGATVNSLRGNEMAVMLGDYLISNAFHLCSSLGDPAINFELGDVTNTLCAGELLQLHFRDQYSIDEETYFEIIRRKTASLVAACCRLGARLAGGDAAAVEALGRFGMALGVAFQIQDDLLDLVGDQSVVGKSLGRDLDKGKLTLPVILHLAQAGVHERAASLRMIQERDAERLRQRLLDGGAVQRTRDVAARLVGEAKRHLAPAPPGAAKHLLERAADAVIARSR